MDSYLPPLPKKKYEKNFPKVPFPSLLFEQLQSLHTKQQQQQQQQQGIFKGRDPRSEYANTEESEPPSLSLYAESVWGGVVAVPRDFTTSSSTSLTYSDRFSLVGAKFGLGE